MANLECIILEKDDGVARITLNRPDKLNALGSQILFEIQEALRIVQDDDSLKVVVIAAKGKFFCAGGDLEESDKNADDPEAGQKMGELGHCTFDAIENYPKPVVAAVQGNALAGGLELVEACDIVIAAENARFGDQHANFGLIPGGGSSQRLPRLIGIRKAKELMLTGDWISAVEAERLGLVNKVVPADKLDEEVESMCTKLKTKSPLVCRTVKKLINRGMQMDLASALEMERMATNLHARSFDFQEGVRAFKEKRRPEFKGR